VVSEVSNDRQERLYHVERLKHLTLVTGTIAIQSKCAIFVTHILLGKSDTSANRDLSANYSISPEERRSEDVHGTTLAVRHATLATEKLAEDTGDGPTTHDGERMAAIAGNDFVVWFDAVFKTDRHGFLPGD